MSTPQAIFTVHAPDLDRLPLHDAEATLRALVEPFGATVAVHRESVDVVGNDAFKYNVGNTVYRSCSPTSKERVCVELLGVGDRYHDPSRDPDEVWWDVQVISVDGDNVHIDARRWVPDDADFIGLVRAELAKTDDLDPQQVLRVKEVVFDTTEYDNGFFFDGSATVVFTDDSRQTCVDLSGLDSFLSDLSAEYAPLGRQAQLRVNLHTNTLDTEDYGFY